MCVEGVLAALCERLGVDRDTRGCQEGDLTAGHGPDLAAILQFFCGGVALLRMPAPGGLRPPRRSNSRGELQAVPKAGGHNLKSAGVTAC